MGATRSRATRGLTLDVGALIALERGDGNMIALLQEALKQRVALSVPAGVVGQVWRDGARQVTLARFFRSREVFPLDELTARAAGELCGLSGTSDVIDAQVVITARSERQTVVTSEPDDLRDSTRR